MSGPSIPNDEHDHEGLSAGSLPLVTSMRRGWLSGSRKTGPSLVPLVNLRTKMKFVS